MCLLGFLLALLCLDTTSFCYFPTSTETQFQVRYLHFWPLKTASWTSKTTFGSKFLSFARAEQMLLIYRRIQWFVSRMCNRRNAKRTTFHGKTTPFTAQKGSFCNAKGASLPSWTITSGGQRSPFLCFEVIETLSWTIKTAREISRIRFSFVTISYCQYNICMVNFGFIRNIEW